jgi:serine/threonine-protein kinase
VQVEPLIDAALDLPSQERTAFLDRVCPDDELRLDVDWLVAECERVDDPLDRVAVERFAGLFDEAPPGELNERFMIERQIGRGGMATVYLAHDRKHDRPVAVKILGPEAGVAIGADRFRREIALAARLQHAHIVPLYDSGDQDGWLYYVMPVMNGGCLRERLLRDGPPGLDITTRIAADVGEALAYAHARGFLHRDIKPENILFDGDRAVLADFGIARALGTLSSADLIPLGRATGTPAYMSPEQAAGSVSLDVRSDVYSLGTVVYEMLTGVPPAGPSQAPTALPLPPDTPSHVQDAVRRALAVAPEHRFDSAEQFVRALTGDLRTRAGPSTHRRAVLAATAVVVLAASGALVWRTGGVRPWPATDAEPSIAVLPLSGVSSDSASRGFADGMIDALGAAIANAGRVRVVSGFRSIPVGGPSDAHSLGAALHVSHLLEGSLQRSGSRIRLSVQLIDAATGSTRWSDIYEQGFDELFSTEDAIGRSVVAAVGARAAPSKRRGPAPGAFELYLRGSELRLLRTDSMARVAVGYFLDAIAADSTFVPAFAGLARAYSAVCQGLEPVRQRMAACDSATIAATRAIALDSSLADGYRALSFASLAANDVSAAARAARRAVTLDPDNEEAYEFLANVHHWIGRHDEALVDARRALELNPLSMGASVEMGRALFYENRDDEALAELEPFRAIRPAIRRVPHIVGRIYERRQMWREAMTEYNKLPGTASSGLVGRVFAESGQRAAADSILSVLEAKWERGVGRAWDVTMVLIGMHDYDAAFKWIDRSIDDHSLRVDVMDPTFEEFRADPRFAGVLRRLGISN